MGMYTEIHVAGECQIGTEAEAVIRYLFDTNGPKEPPDKLPDHAFFGCDRWRHIGSCASFYLSPIPLRGILESGNNLRFHSVSNIKNYGSEIELFFDWLQSEQIRHYGHWRYEETPHQAHLYCFLYCFEGYDEGEA